MIKFLIKKIYLDICANYEKKISFENELIFMGVAQYAIWKLINYEFKLAEIV